MGFPEKDSILVCTLRGELRPRVVLGGNGNAMRVMEHEEGYAKNIIQNLPLLRNCVYFGAGFSLYSLVLTLIGFGKYPYKEERINLSPGQSTSNHLPIHYTQLNLVSVIVCINNQTAWGIQQKPELVKGLHTDQKF